MMRKLAVGFLSFFLSMVIAWAASDPVAMLQNASNQMISSLNANKATIKTNRSYVEGLARKVVLPLVDTQTMAKLALGRNGWMSASPAQRQQFIDQFITLMIRTYSTALASYTNQTMEFTPLRSGSANQERIQVYSKIIQPEGPAIPVSYRLINRGSDWKIYDISVDGVSMVQSFRSQFASELSQGGMNGLLNAMQKHNTGLNKK